MMTLNSESLLINAHADMRGNNKLSATTSRRRAADRITINWADEGQLAGNSENRIPCSSNDCQLNRKSLI